MAVAVAGLLAYLAVSAFVVCHCIWFVWAQTQQWGARHERAADQNIIALAGAELLG